MCEVKKVRATRKVKKVTGEKALARFTQQGFRLTYRPGQVNHCPGCSKSNWWVSKTSVECAFCGTSMDIEGAHRSSTRIVAHRPLAEEFILCDSRPKIEPLIPARGFRRILEKFA